MSTKIMNACWDLQMPLPKKMLLISLADQANDQGVCSPALDATATRCCLSRPTLFRALAWLETRGYMRRQGTDRRQKTYLLTPNLGRVSGPEPGESVVSERDHGGLTVRLPKSQPETTVVSERDHGGLTARLPAENPPHTPPKDKRKDKEEERAARASEGPSADSEATGVPADFRPPPWVADRLAIAGLPREFEAHHVQHFVANHQAKGTLRAGADAWGNEFVSWMIREHKQFAPAKKPAGRAPPPPATPEQQRANAVNSAVSDLASDLRAAHRMQLADPGWKDPDGIAVMAELGGWVALRQLDRQDFERLVGEFARRYRLRRLTAEPQREQA